MAKLKAINAIWNKINPVAPGDSFECNDQREIDRLVSSGAAIVDESTAVVNEQDRVSGILSFQRIAIVAGVEHLINDALNNSAATKESVAVQILTLMDLSLNSGAGHSSTLQSGVTTVNEGIANIIQTNDSTSSNENPATSGSDMFDSSNTLTSAEQDMDKVITDDTSVPKNSFKIPGIDDDAIVNILTAAGFDSIEKVKQLTKEQLVAVPGLGYNNAQKVFKALK